MTKNLFNFTKDRLTKIDYPKTKQVVYKDTTEKGLILIVSYGGSKTFYFGKKIKDRYHRIKIGRFPDISIQEAREQAIDLKSQIAKGINPVEKEDITEEIKNTNNDEMSFKKLFDKYINDYAMNKNKTWKADIAMMERNAKHLYDTKLSDISRDDIQKIFNNCIKLNPVNPRMTGKISANRCLGKFKSIFNKAIAWGWEGKNPANNIEKYPEKSRDRYLVAEEKPVFFEVLEEENNQAIKDFILLCLYTGARKSNVLAMHWNNISLRNKTWYIPYTKNKESHTLPLTSKAMQILETRHKHRNSDWVFPSKHNSKSGHLEDPKWTWKKIRKKANLTDFRLHDLRRTMGSWMAISGASQYVIAKTLNHKNIRSTDVYARLSLDPVREFMEKADSVFDKYQKV